MLIVPRHYFLPNDAIVQINSFISERQSRKLANETQLTIRGKKHWIKVGSYTLTITHKEAILKGHELDDMHINVAQLMLKQSFPELGGLQNVLLNNKNPLANAETGLYISTIITGVHCHILINVFATTIHHIQHSPLQQSGLLQICFIHRIMVPN